MTPAEISQTYQALEGLEIRLTHTPELGPDYLRDRLLECREKQNTVTDLIVKTNRAYSIVRQQLRAQEAALRHAGTTEQATRMREDRDAYMDEQDAVKLLLDALNVRRGNLARTSSDIRLLEKMLADGLAHGAQGGKPQPARPVPTSLPNVDSSLRDVVMQEVGERRFENDEIVVLPVVVLEPPQPPSVPEAPVTMLTDDDLDIDRFLDS